MSTVYPYATAAAAGERIAAADDNAADGASV